MGGAFAAPVTNGAGRNPWGVAVGDFDQDGRADLAIANAGRPGDPATDIGVRLNTTNRGPSASADDYATDEDVPLAVTAPGVLGNDDDPDGDALTAELVSEPDHGELTLADDGSLTYTPDADYHGPDAFSYRVDDGALESGTTTAAIDVRSVDDPAPPVRRATAPAPAPAAGEPALSRVRIGARCVRRSGHGRVRVPLSLRLARPGAVQIRIARAAGSKGRSSCPRRTRGTTRRDRTTRFRPVATVRPAQASAAAVARRFVLRLRLRPGLYRISVRADLGDGRRSAPVHRYLRVLV